MSTFATTTFRHIRGINRGMKSPVLPIYWQYGPVKWTCTGGGERTRTADFHVANVALYQLSYTPKETTCAQRTTSHVSLSLGIRNDSGAARRIHKGS